jgi:DNA-binding CsgD family transcriptional regulator
MVAVSENIEEFTGATKSDWLKASPMMFFSRVHPDDADYIMGSLALIKNLIESKSISERDYLRYNIYCRFLKKNGEYEWFLWQCPAIFFSEKNEIEANFSLMVEMPQLASIIEVPIMTLIDNNQKENQYFKVLAETNSLKSLELPNITKREQEVIRLMASGLKTPQIAEKLFISEITVEHHKKNLRVKTETKTSVELMSFVMRNNLI